MSNELQSVPGTFNISVEWMPDATEEQKNAANNWVVSVNEDLKNDEDTMPASVKSIKISRA